MGHPYSVSLKGAPSLPPSARIAAETRFAVAVERALGGPEEVARAYSAWLTAKEASAHSLDQETAIAAVRWPRAYNKGVQAGLRGRGPVPDAQFELTLEGPGTGAGAVHRLR